jgi:hypothetical protein
MPRSLIRSEPSVRESPSLTVARPSMPRLSTRSSLADNRISRPIMATVSTASTSQRQRLRDHAGAPAFARRLNRVFSIWQTMS